MVKFLGLPREPKFFDFFEESVSNLAATAEALVDLFANYKDVPDKVKHLTDLEHEGDTITHKIIEQLHLTFVTPLDREDIYALANYLDDMRDYMKGAAMAMLLYHIEQPTPKARDFANILTHQIAALTLAIPRLRHRSQMKGILLHCYETVRWEKEADNTIRLALAELFENNLPVIEIIKWREIYEHLENAADRGEDLANVLEGIVLKYG